MASNTSNNSQRDQESTEEGQRQDTEVEDWRAQETVEQHGHKSAEGEEDERQTGQSTSNVSAAEATFWHNKHLGQI